MSKENNCNNLPVYTEFLLIFSQTVCFIVIFNKLQNLIVIDKGLILDLSTAKKNLIQLLAIYFAIYIILCLLMSPLWQYAYSHFVVLLVSIYTFSKLLLRLYKLHDSPTIKLPTFKKTETKF